MNDLELLEAHGPAATPLSAPTLDRARSALLHEIAQETNQQTTTAMAHAPEGSTTAWRRRFAAAAVAAAVAGAAFIAPSLVGVGSSGAIALAPFDPLSFPLTPSVVPDGLSAPTFSLDTGFMLARYEDGAHDGLTVIAKVTSDKFWTSREGGRFVDVSGHRAAMFAGVAYDGTPTGMPSLSVVWRGNDGDWVGVTGRGAYADSETVRSFAESLRERPQPVNLGLKVAPEGWSIDAYSFDRNIMLSPNEGPSDVDLSVTLVDNPPKDFSRAYGARQVTDVQVHNHTAHVGKAAEGWIVLASTADGVAYSVQAPDTFTRQQAVAVADGVTYTG